MDLVRGRLVLWLSAGLLAAGACAGTDEPEGPPFRAYVIEQISVDGRGVGEFAVVPRELTRVTRLETLEGPSYRIARGGELRARSFAGSVVMDGEFHGEEPLDLRYRVEDGVILARDYSTLAMLSAARQFERVFDALEEHGPYPPERLFAGLGRPNIHFEPEIELSGDVSATATLKFNAFFVTESGDFGLARRSDAEAVPLAADLKVIAHEVGHAAFLQALHHADRGRCNERNGNLGQRWFEGRLEAEYVVRGLDEGFADWFSFSVTGSVDALGNQTALMKDRSLRVVWFDWGDLAQASEGFGVLRTDWVNECADRYYCIGTLFAQALYEAYLRLGLDRTDPVERGAFTRALVSGLERTRETLETRALLPPADAMVASCALRENIEPAYDAQVLGGFMSALLSNLSPELRGPLCMGLAMRFGEEGFAPEHRGECPR